jgi:hypothetical protein
MHLRRDFQSQRFEPDEAGGDGARNLLRRRGEAEAMDEVGGHNFMTNFQAKFLAPDNNLCSQPTARTRWQQYF